MRRALASVATLGLLGTFLLAVILGVMVATGTVNAVVAVALVVLVNLAVLLFRPRLNDFIYGWLYDLEWITLEELRRRSPRSVEVIEEVTAEYGYDAPRVGVIPDRNPTAFTYGSARYNARVVFTEGCEEFLDDDELASVVAHELGHVTSRDFVVMTVANTIVQVLYLLAIYSRRIAAAGQSSSNRRGNAAAPLFAVAALSYLLWYVGEYAVLFLSRVREYAADGFSAAYTHPDDLSNALVKIALGIVTTEDSPELARATRNIGIMSVAESKEKGVLYYTAREFGDRAPLLQAFLFDLHSPWATLLELGSTHPLTGKRVRALSREEGATAFDFEEIERRFEVDRWRLYVEFLRDLAVVALPTLLAVGYPLGYLGLAVTGTVELDLVLLVGGWPAVVGLAMLARALYRYPPGEAEATTVVELLGDVYASPVRGRRARLEGELIGRGQAGYRFSEDLLFRDDTGLMYLKYDSWLPLLGDLLFAVRRVPGLIGERVAVEGWYLRGTTTWLGLRSIDTDDERIRGFVNLGSVVAGLLLLVLGAALLGFRFLA
ncbi:MAG: M48 family metalloprotease [Haloarculaceae archaeon]